MTTDFQILATQMISIIELLREDCMQNLYYNYDSSTISLQYTTAMQILHVPRSDEVIRWNQSG